MFRQGTSDTLSETGVEIYNSYDPCFWAYDPPIFGCWCHILSLTRFLLLFLVSARSCMETVFDDKLQ